MQKIIICIKVEFKFINKNSLNVGKVEHVNDIVIIKTNAMRVLIGSVDCSMGNGESFLGNGDGDKLGTREW